MTSTFTPQERLASLQVGAIAGLSTLLTAVLLLLAHRAIATGWPAAVAINLSGLSGLTFVVSSLIAGLFWLFIWRHLPLRCALRRQFPAQSRRHQRLWAGAGAGSGGCGFSRCSKLLAFFDSGA